MKRLTNTGKTARFSFHLLLLSGWVYSTGFAQLVSPQAFSLHGRLFSPRQGKIYLLDKDKLRIDSAEIVANQFEFRGKIAEPDLYQLQVANEVKTYPVFLEGVSVNITFTTDQTYQVMGSPLHAQWDELENQYIEAVTNELVRLFSERSIAQQKGDTLRLRELMRQNDSVSVSIGRRIIESMTRQPYTFFNLYLLNYRSPSDEFTINQLNELRVQFSGYPTFQKLERGLKEKQQLRQRIAPGQVASPFSLPDSSGNVHSLASLTNKVVLVDFWASWCGPCIKQMPALKALEAAFGQQGLTIIGVSIDDDRQRWLQALRRFRPVGVQLLASKNEELKAQYVVFSIPQTYLIAADGKIIATNLQEAALREKVAELLQGRR